MRRRQGPRAPEGARRGGLKGRGVRSKSGLQLLGIALAALALALLPALPAEFWGPIRPSGRRWAAPEPGRRQCSRTSS